MSALRWSVAVIYPLQKHSLSQHSTQTTSGPQRFWLRNLQKHLSYVGSAKTLGNGPPRASLAGACIAHPSRPLGTEDSRERRDLRGNAGTAGLGRPTASPLAWFRFRLQQRGLPAVADAAGCAAFKGSADRFSPREDLSVSLSSSSVSNRTGRPVGGRPGRPVSTETQKHRLGLCSTSKKTKF